MSEIINDLSEDIFQDNDSQYQTLRRSQRVLDKLSKAQDTEDLIPPNQIPTEAAEILSATDVDREQTPDFTHLHATSQINSLEATATVGYIIENGGNINLESNFELPLDLRSKTTQKFSKESIAIDEKNNKSLANATPEIVDEKLKAPAPDNTFIITFTQETTQSSVLCASTEYNNNAESQKIELHKTVGGTVDVDAVTQKSVAVVRRPRRKPIRSNARTRKNSTSDSVAQSQLSQSAVKTASKPRQRKPRGAQMESLPKSPKLPAITSTVIRRALPQKRHTTAAAASAVSSNLPYVPPKVMRFHNSCPAFTASIDHFTPINQSLLPPVYPAHFSNQIAMPSSSVTPSLTQAEYVNLVTPASSSSVTPSLTQAEYVNLVTPPSSSSTIPISLITPENSEMMAIESSNEILTSQPADNSPLSFKNFFKIEEIHEIFDTGKTVFELTELHVRALAVVLNMDSNELFKKLADIAKSDNNCLQKLLTIAERNPMGI